MELVTPVGSDSCKLWSTIIHSDITAGTTSISKPKINRFLIPQKDVVISQGLSYWTIMGVVYPPHGYVTGQLACLQKMKYSGGQFLGYVCVHVRAAAFLLVVARLCG